MNLSRAIKGLLLSLVFLGFFVYMIFGLQWVFDNFSQSQNKTVFLGSVSDNFRDFNLENVTGGTVLIQGVVPEIRAKAAISVESNSYGEKKIIFEKDSDARLPIASLTKLMTAVIVLDNYDLSDTITVNEVADSQESVRQDVKLGDTMPVESFLDIMLVGSSNKSAYALSEKIGEQKFIGLMNQKAKDMGLDNTFFADSTGLSSRNVSTARDLIKLAEHILREYPKIANISKVKDFYVPNFGKVENTDQLLSEMPEAICSKTGFTDAAKGCLLLVVDSPKNNGYLINVILGSDDRFAEMKKLINFCE
ncbi:MAG: serine hydrolase [Candidatus Staskawiczbacteria bacterium]|nr:serine hydrolase [Candidatus Staskawiczbacteria bacterium]